MTRRNGRTALRTGVAAGLWAMTLIGSVDASRAQEPDGRAVSITIPAKPLPQAIASLSAVTGLQVLYAGRTGRGLTSHPVSGVLTPEEALGTLLQGTGLTYVSRGPGAVTIEETGSTGGGEASADGSIVLDTIVVQSPTFGTSGFVASRSTAGNKSNTPLIEVPSTVNVVTRDELDARDVQDVNQALAYTPGVRAIDYPGGQGAAQVYIRGFRTINSEGVYRDGLRAGFNAYDTNYEPYGLERVDVLKGPASSLYGQGQPGGIFNLVSKRPQFTPSREVAVQTGSHDRIQGTFDLTGPVQEGGSLAYRLTGLVRNSDTQTPYTPDDRIFLAPALTFEPSDQTSLTILGNYLQLRRGGSEQSLPISGSLGPNPFGDYSRHVFLGEPDFNEEKVVNGSAGYIFDHAFSDALRFQSVSRATRTDSHYQAVGALGTPLQGDRLYDRIPYDRRQDSRSLQTDNRFEANFDLLGVEHTALVGLDVSRYKRDERRRLGSIGPIDIFDPVYGQPILLPQNPNISTLNELSQTGVYYQDQLKTNGFIVTLGGRNDWAESETRNRIRNVEQTRRDDAFTYRAGLGYETDFGLVPFVNYATSFNPQVFSTFDGTAFEPAEGKQIEAGVKYQPADWNLFLQASVFEIRQTNVPTPDLAHPGYFIPTGEARSRGLELEAKASLAEGLDLTASYTYLDATVTKDNVNPFTGESLEGKRLGAVPDHSASLWLDYTLQDDTFVGLRLGGGLRYVGSTTNSTNVDHIPGYVLVDAALSYDAGRLDPRFEGLDVSLNVDNLFDKRYFTPGFYEATVFQGFGRDIRGTLTYKW